VRVGEAGELRSVGAPRLFENSYESNRPQRRLFELDALGEVGWLRPFRLKNYVARGPRRSQALQQALFAYADAL